ncbi:DUF3007 family protein [Candidatus Cyanaurora vandensis]|uniref:DUF3007 family protein n=1 Tax=Candidatus Cyanaurora vandensis TaxID=2714958 RepID=UPI00257F9C84|nr:DUF3007 family protein [Candidatus Cyanaurora vandensis]
MRRLDILTYTLVLLVLGPLLYGVLQLVGLSALNAGLVVQALFVAGVILWLGSYVFRVFFRKMTYNQQMKDYKDAVLEKRAEAYYQKLAETEQQESHESNRG